MTQSSVWAIHTRSRGRSETFSRLGGHLAGSRMLPLPAIVARPHGRPGQIRVPDLGDDASLQGGSPPRTTRFIKGGWRSRSPPLCSSAPALDLVIAFDSALLSSSQRLHLHFSTGLRPPTWSNLPLHPLALDSAFYTQVPPFMPDSRVAFSGRSQLHELLRSKKRCASWRGGIGLRSIPLKT